MSQEIRTGKKRKTGDEMHKSEVHRNGTATGGCPYVKKCGGCNMLDYFRCVSGRDTLGSTGGGVPDRGPESGSDYSGYSWTVKIIPYEGL